MPEIAAHCIQKYIVEVRHADEGAYMTHTQRLYTHPPDVTRIEDWDQHSGRLYVHDRNLFHHIGRISTESVKNTDAFREKYRALREDVCGQNGI